MSGQYGKRAGGRRLNSWRGVAADVRRLKVRGEVWDSLLTSAATGMDAGRGIS
jgi:hypothetical protein